MKKFLIENDLEQNYLIPNSEIKDIMSKKNHKYIYGDVVLGVICKKDELSEDNIKKFMHNSLLPNFYYVCTINISNTNELNDSSVVRSLTNANVISLDIDPSELLGLIEDGYDMLGEWYNQIYPNESSYIWYRLQLIKSPLNEKSDYLDLQRAKNYMDPLGLWKDKKLKESLIPYNNNYSTWGKELFDISHILNKPSSYKGKYYELNKNIIVFIRDVNMINNEIMGYIYIDGKKRYMFKDYKVEDNEIKRIYSPSNKEHIMKNNKLLYYNQLIKSKPFTLLKKEVKDNIKNITTFDIETYSDPKNIQIPYACGYFNKKSKLYYIDDYKYNSKDMLTQCLTDMCEDKNIKYVYTHNFSKFDSHLIDNLFQKFKMETVLNNRDQILSCKVSLNKDSYIIIRDSLLLLPRSLRHLSNTFNVDTKKSYFPYTFVNENTLNYIGDKPLIKYYENIPENDYDLIPNKNWSLKENTLKYLKMDLQSLYEVIILFRDKIIKDENVDPISVITLPSLAMKIWKKNYYKENNIYTIKNALRYDIKRAFFGGICEVYNRYSKKDLYIYDINSSYPSSMLKPLPVGQPKLSSDTCLENYNCGFVFAKIETPKDEKGNYIELKYPPLPYKTKTKVINPIGLWSGMYSSELLKWVKNNYNYNINVLYGYKFDVSNKIFKDYINKYYNLKNNANNDVERDISKLMLNSLYGKFGLDAISIKTTVTTQEKAAEIALTKYTKSIKDLPNNEVRIRYIDIDKKSNLDPHIIPEMYTDHNVAIAATITSYSIMNLFNAVRHIESKGGIIYYVDTDSIHCNIPLDDNMIGNKIGLWKLERYSDKPGYYISPKLYYINSKENGDYLPIIKTRSIKDPELNGLNEESFKRLINNETIYINQMRFKTINSLIIKTDSEFKLNGILKKRLLNNDNINTKPLIVNDITTHKSMLIK